MTNPIINYHPFLAPLDTNLFTTVLTQDLAGEQAFVWGTPTSESWTTGTKTITGVEVVYHSTTQNSASIWNVSLQALSSSGNPRRPTGTPLAMWSGSVTSSQISPNVLNTHMFTSSYTITTGSRLGVLFKYDTFVAPTSIALRALNSRGDYNSKHATSTSLTTGSTWTLQTPNPVAIRFLCSDNTKLYFDGTLDAMSLGLVTANDFSSTSTGVTIDSGDERGMLWIPKKTYDITRFDIVSRLSATSSITNFRMYRDTTLLANKTVFPADNPDIATFFAYPVDLTSSIRVYPNDNIRFTQMPVSGNTRHVRFTFNAPIDLQNFFGGADDEINFSYTNRVNEGAWNTPTGSNSSSFLFQIYGTEVTGSALVSGSLKISGSVLQTGSPVSGARIFALRQSDGLVATTSSAADGTYALNLTSSVYHVFAEYQSGSQRYNALSAWNVQPV